MKTTFYSRLLFGASAVLFGVIALLWHDADTWQSLRTIWRLPLGTLAGDCLMIAQIAGGIGLLYPRTMRLAASVLAVVYVLFSLACVPGIIAKPAVYQEYGSFFEQFCLLCGAAAACSVAFRRFARIGLGLCATSFALDQAFYLRETAGLVPTWIPPSPMFWAILTTAAFAVAGIAILINLWAPLAIRLMTLMLAVFAVLVWVPLVIAQPKAHGNWSELALTLLITGASWMVLTYATTPVRGVSHRRRFMSAG